jgi:hypothetical protein
MSLPGQGRLMGDGWITGAMTSIAGLLQKASLPV